MCLAVLVIDSLTLMTSLVVVAVVIQSLMMDSLMTFLVVVAVVIQSVVMDSLMYPSGFHSVAV